MEIGTTLYVKDRRQWRSWLARHHRTAPEIWLIYYKKHRGTPRIPYSDAVEEALCYGGIDSIVKPVDEDRWAQRFSPRRPSSRLSAMNRERVRRLIAARRMTKAGLERIAHVFDHTRDTKRKVKWQIPPDIPDGPQTGSDDVEALPGVSRVLQKDPDRLDRGREAPAGDPAATAAALPQDDRSEQAVRDGAVTQLTLSTASMKLSVLVSTHSTDTASTFIVPMRSVLLVTIRPLLGDGLMSRATAMPRRGS